MAPQEEGSAGGFWRLGQAGEGGKGSAGVDFGPKEMKPFRSDSIQALLKAGSMCALCDVSLNVTFRPWNLKNRVRHSQDALSL